MTHMKLTATNLQSLLDVLEIEDDGTDPDSFDRLCAMAVRDAIDMTARIAELTAEVAQSWAAAHQSKDRSDMLNKDNEALREALRRVMGNCEAVGEVDPSVVAIDVYNIARNALKDGV